MVTFRSSQYWIYKQPLLIISFLVFLVHLSYFLLSYSEDVKGSIQENFEQCSSNSDDDIVKRNRVKELMKQAENLHMKKKYHDAISFYGQAILVDPDDENIYYKRSRSHSKVGNRELEIEDLSFVIKASPNNIKANSFLGKVLLEIGDCEASADAFKRVLAHKPTHADAKKLFPKAEQCEHTLRQIHSDMEAGSYENAVLLATNLLETMGKISALLYLRGLARYKNGYFFEAIADSGEILKKEPNNVNALLLRGMSYYSVGDNEMAQRHFKEGLASDPDHPEMKKWFSKVLKIVRLAKLGVSKLQKDGEEHWFAALNDFTEATKVDPSNSVYNSVLFKNICLANKKLRDYDAAITACESAIKLDNVTTEPYVLLAKIASDLAETESEFEDALRAWRRAHDIDQNDPDIQNGLRKAEVALKQSKSEKNYYKILGIKREADQSEIKKAYHNLALDLHPDRHSSKNEKEKEAMKKQFEIVVRAYEVLSDENLRDKYDRGEDVSEGQGNQRENQQHHQYEHFVRFFTYQS